MLRRVCVVTLFACVGLATTLAGSSETYEAKISRLPDSVKEDIGDIHPIAEATFFSHFHGNVQLRGIYTSNARLRGNRGSPDYLTIPTLEEGFTAPLGKGFDLDSIFRAETTIYSRYNERSFWGFGGATNLGYRYRPTWPHAYLGSEQYYYESYENGDKLASAVSMQAGLDQSFTLNRGKTLLFAGYNFGHYFAFPDLDTRNSHRLTFSLTQQLRPALYAQFFYQWQYSAYTQEDRDDSRNVIGLNFIYQFTPHLFGSLNSAFVDNNSSLSPASYQNVTTGAGLSWQF